MIARELDDLLDMPGMREGAAIDQQVLRPGGLRAEIIRGSKQSVHGKGILRFGVVGGSTGEHGGADLVLAEDDG